MSRSKRVTQMDETGIISGNLGKREEKNKFVADCWINKRLWHTVCTCCVCVWFPQSEEWLNKGVLNQSCGDDWTRNHEKAI